MTIREALARLEKSRFRSSFYLTKIDKAYCNEKGEALIRSHAEAFISQKLAPAFPSNDGKQTPMSGHPVFKAMHATACCCRDCFNKWYNVPKGRPLTDAEQKAAVDLIMAWLKKQREFNALLSKSFHCW